MTDALRSDRSSAGRDLSDRERDARIDELLLTGLDHYFAGRHELAINVWSRVLFLDRGHAKARAYIERARSALSEHQREGDELFHTGAAALHRGDRAAARELLTSAVDRGPSEEALVLLHRLDRIEAATAPISAPPPAGSPGTERREERVSPGPGGDQRVVWVAGGIFAGVLIAVVAGAYVWIVADPFDAGAPRTPVLQAVEVPLPVPSAGELRLRRARELAARGELREALTLLEAGTIDDRARGAANELRAAIQRQLLDDARRIAGGGGRGTKAASPFSPPPERPSPR